MITQRTLDGRDFVDGKPEPVRHYHLLKFKSMHQRRVDSFMVKAEQNLPLEPTVPTEAERLLRAKIIFEETLETIRDGLGVDVWISGTTLGVSWEAAVTQMADRARFTVERPFDMVETIDGCCDIKVVTTGTLSAIGVPDDPFQLLVDNNNLDKFGPGGYRREDGKWIKPPTHQPPKIKELLAQLVQAEFVTNETSA